MQNRARLNRGGFVEVAYVGEQSNETVTEMVARALPLADRLAERNRPVLILADLSGLTKSTAGSRKATAEALRTISYERIAVCGGNKYVKNLAKLVITATRRANRVRLFDKREEAVAWLGEA